MPKIRCPRCETIIESGKAAGGTLLRCPDCGIQVRVPTGNTSVRQAPVPAATAAAPAPAPAPEKKKGPGRQTSLFRKMSGVKGPGQGGRPRAVPQAGGGGGNKNALIICGIAGAVILIAGGAFFMTGNKHGTPPPTSKREKAPQPALPPPPPSAPASFPPPPAGASGKFEKGARPLAITMGGKGYDLNLNAGLTTDYASLAVASRTTDIVREDYKWLLYVLDGLLSDTEEIAKTSMFALYEISRKRNVNPGIDPNSWPSGESRAQEYHAWVFRWWLNKQNQTLVAKWAEEAGAQPPPAAAPSDSAAPPPPVAAAGGNHDGLIRDLLQGGFTDKGTPAGLAFNQFKRMGKSAYPVLINYIGHEDLTWARIATAALNELTTHKTALPNESTRDAIKKDWEGFVAASP